MNAACDSARLSLDPDGSYQETPWIGGAFLYGLVCLHRPKSVVEVGCHVGSAACYIMQALMDIGFGSYTGYEKDTSKALACSLMAQNAWPVGKWKIVTGDFFETYDGAPTDFAFIDLEPKSSYTEAYDKLNLEPSCVVVAHDLFLDNEGRHVAALGSRLKSDGFDTFGFVPARGFLLGVRL